MRFITVTSTSDHFNVERTVKSTIAAHRIVRMYKDESLSPSWPQGCIIVMDELVEDSRNIYVDQTPDEIVARIAEATEI